MVESNITFGGTLKVDPYLYQIRRYPEKQREIRKAMKNAVGAFKELDDTFYHQLAKEIGYPVVGGSRAVEVCFPAGVEEWLLTF